MATTSASWRARSSSASTSRPRPCRRRTRCPPSSSSFTRRSMIHFSSFASGTPKRSRPPGRLVALVDRDLVAELVQLRRPRPGPPGRSPPRPPSCRCGGRAARRSIQPSSKPRAGDRQLDLLDRDRVVVDVQHAGRLARRRADQARELGEVVGRVQLHERVLPAVAVDEVVPVRDPVAERAALVAERARRSPCSARPARAASRRPAARSTAGSRARARCGSRFSNPTRSMRRKPLGSPTHQAPRGRPAGSGCGSSSSASARL